jgi:iron complex outermembrane receptor protein
MFVLRTTSTGGASLDCSNASLFGPPFGQALRRGRRIACSASVALVIILISAQSSPAQDASKDTSTDTSQTAPGDSPGTPAGAPDRSSDPKPTDDPSAAPDSKTLPPVTVTSPAPPKARPKQRLRPAAATTARRTAPVERSPPPAPATRPLPEGVVLNGGPPVVWTTAGPVSGYRALTAVTATKTDTPIERIPQSIQVIPRSVIDDQQPLTQSEALRNVSGVIGMPTNTYVGSAYKVRGFPADRFVDGLPNYFDGGDFVSLVNTERIEVLKGPSGILYQAGLNPVGGIINSISKLPTPVRSYDAGFMAGGFGLWNPWFDINQPLNRDGTALFRVTGDFERSRDYRRDPASALFAKSDAPSQQ